MLEILLRTAPNAYHLIEWALVLVDQSTALEMEQQGEGRPLARKAPAEKEPLAIRATGSFTAAKMRHLESIS